MTDGTFLTWVGLRGFLSVDDEGNGTLFGFEHCGPGWLAYDVAVVQWGLQHDLGRFDARLWSAFLSGYTCVRELTDPELEAIPVFMVARSIWKIGQLTANADSRGHRALTPQYFSRALRSITDAAIEAGYVEPGSDTLVDFSAQQSVFSGRSDELVRAGGR